MMFLQSGKLTEHGTHASLTLNPIWSGKLLAGLLHVQEMKQKEHNVKENLGHFMGTYKKYLNSAHVKPLNRMFGGCPDL